MKALRKILGVVVLLLAVLFAASAAVAAAHKLGKLPVIEQLAAYTPQFDAAPWWQVAVLGAAALFWLVSAASLLRNTRQALIPYIAAFIAAGVVWWFVCQQPKHGLTFAVEGREHEIGIWAALVVLGVLVAITDRRKRYRPDAE